MSVAVKYGGDSERFQKLRESPGTDGGELIRERDSAFFMKVCLRSVGEFFFWSGVRYVG